MKAEGITTSTNLRGSCTLKCFPSGNHETIEESNFSSTLDNISCNRYGKGTTYRKPEPETTRIEPALEAPGTDRGARVLCSLEFHGSVVLIIFETVNAFMFFFLRFLLCEKRVSLFEQSRTPSEVKDVNRDADGFALKRGTSIALQNC